ncbi:MAG: nucleotidyltransferase family protein [Candidatus Omnitrophica bacterium]|nr:nucleotidyltransferase family protein [Candidatus Omnitrophota bacterium]
MKALILAAGYATRLYPLTKDYPKPLLHIGKRPIIDYIVDRLSQVPEIDEIIVVTNSKFIHRFQSWAEKIKTKKTLSLVDDLTKDLTDRRGAIGDTFFAIKDRKIKDDLLVVGGDNIFDGSLSDFISFAEKNKPSPVIGAYDIGKKSFAKKYGVIKVDKENKIIDFQEKPKFPKSTLVAMCLYYFPAKELRLIKEYMDSRVNKHDATGLYIDWLRKKVSVYGFVFRGRWFDIGDYKYYNEAKEEFANN